MRKGNAEGNQVEESCYQLSVRMRPPSPKPNAQYFTRRFRYGTLIVFANYLIDKTDKPFAKWLTEHREITTVLGRRSLD